MDMLLHNILMIMLFIFVVAMTVKGIRFLKTCIHNVKTMDNPLFCKIDDVKFPSAQRNYEIVICAIKKVYKENGLLDQQLKTMNNSEALEFLWSRRVYLDDITGLMDRALMDLKAIASGMLASLIIMISEEFNDKDNIIMFIFGGIFFIVLAFILIFSQYYYRGKHKLYSEVTEEYEKKLLNKKMEDLIDEIEMEEPLFNVFALRQWACHSYYHKRFKSRHNKKALMELQKMSFFEKDVRDLEFVKYRTKNTELVFPSQLDNKRKEVELPDGIQRLLELVKEEL